MNIFGFSDDFENLQDEALVKMSKSGNSAAFDEILRRYSKPVAIISHTYKSDSLTQEDWFQEGMLGLLKAVYSYDEDGGASFSTFASVCIRNSLNSVYRKANNSKNLPLINTAEFDDSDLPLVSSPEDDYITKEQDLIFTSGITKHLTETEWNALRHHLAGLSRKEISEKLAICEKSADNALYRAKAKIKKALKPN